ncbi:hypothetical protein BGZ72_006454 [Mortierella alpina]|nr:hypothetical protein BGZ72_006454 [Mortierella alpina]
MRFIPLTAVTIVALLCSAAAKPFNATVATPDSFNPRSDYDPAAMKELFEVLGANQLPHMVFAGDTSCTKAGWTTAFVFWGPGCHDNSCKGTMAMHESNEMFQAYDPHRMMMYPHYDGTAHGWTKNGQVTYHCRHELPNAEEAAYLKTVVPAILKNHKREVDNTEGDRGLVNCIMQIVGLWDLDEVMRNVRQGTLIFGRDVRSFREAAQHGGFENYVNSARIDVQAPINSELANIQVQIGTKSYANVLIPTGVKIGARSIRRAFLESMQQARTVTLHRAKPTQKWSIILYGLAIIISVLFYPVPLALRSIEGNSTLISDH